MEGRGWGATVSQQHLLKKNTDTPKHSMSLSQYLWLKGSQVEYDVKHRESHCHSKEMMVTCLDQDSDLVKDQFICPYELKTADLM